ncbi:MAG: CO dehydrogenase/CO-methylating acetyl-CoA synthase complex subunit beta [Desulfobacterales bacterium]
MIEIPGIKLPKGRIYQAPTDFDELFDGVEIEISPRWMGQKVRKSDMYMEIGGPKHGYTSYIHCDVMKNAEDVEDGRIELIGPEIDETEPGSSFPFGIWMRYWGTQLTEDHIDPLIRAGFKPFEDGEGWMLVNTRDTIWIRLNNESAHKNSWQRMGQALIGNCKINFPLVEKAEVQIIIATPEVGGVELIRDILDSTIRPEWEAYDARLQGVEDEDVDTFYGCTLCQTFAPNHVCCITPQRNPYCGIMSYLGAKAIVEIDPYGYSFMMPKGECIDPVMGRYTGVDQAIYERSSRRVRKVNLYSCLKYPQTNCGCFEAAAFYLPELDGIGLVDRRHPGDTPLGINFSKMAGYMSGGNQNHGSMGLSARTPKSKKFLQGDGGWKRVVWMPKEFKVLLADCIPEEIYDKIATEEVSIEPNEIKEFLKRVEHPIIKEFWKEGEPVPLKIPGPNEEWPGEENI